MESRAVGEEYVCQAVVVVVKSGHAARHGFDHVLAWCRIVLQAQNQVQPDEQSRENGWSQSGNADSNAFCFVDLQEITQRKRRPENLFE